MNTTIYQNIATRTAGDIYIGVVGPVRTGKSTFIKRFMETQVIPNIENVYRKERARMNCRKAGLKDHHDSGAQICSRGGGADSVGGRRSLFRTAD